MDDSNLLVPPPASNKKKKYIILGSLIAVFLIVLAWGQSTLFKGTLDEPAGGGEAEPAPEPTDACSDLIPITQDACRALLAACTPPSTFSILGVNPKCDIPELGYVLRVEDIATKQAEKAACIGEDREWDMVGGGCLLEMTPEQRAQADAELEQVRRNAEAARQLAEPAPAPTDACSDLPAITQDACRALLAACTPPSTFSILGVNPKCDIPELGYVLRVEDIATKQAEKAACIGEDREWDMVGGGCLLEMTPEQRAQADAELEQVRRNAEAARQLAEQRTACEAAGNRWRQDGGNPRCEEQVREAAAGGNGGAAAAGQGAGGEAGSITDDVVVLDNEALRAFQAACTAIEGRIPEGETFRCELGDAIFTTTEEITAHQERIAQQNTETETGDDTATETPSAEEVALRNRIEYLEYVAASQAREAASAATGSGGSVETRRIAEKIDELKQQLAAAGSSTRSVAVASITTPAASPAPTETSSKKTRGSAEKSRSKTAASDRRTLADAASASAQADALTSREAASGALSSSSQTASSSSDAKKMHGAYIRGKTGPEMALYPLAISVANGLWWFVRRRKKRGAE